MEHIVRTLGKSPELAEYIEGGYDDDVEDLEDIAEEGKTNAEGKAIAGEDNPGYDSRASSRSNRYSRQLGEDNMSSEMETRLTNGLRNSKRYSQMSIVDVADRHLRDKTDAIAHIIRNISEQCAAAVEGLQLAHDAEVQAEELALKEARGHHRSSNMSTHTISDDGQSNLGSDAGESSLHPHGRTSSIPPTPDLIHNRSSTSMSIASTTTTPERNSQQYNVSADIPTRIVEDSDEGLEDERASESENGGAGRLMVDSVPTKRGMLGRPAGARLSALGGR